MLQRYLSALDALLPIGAQIRVVVDQGEDGVIELRKDDDDEDGGGSEEEGDGQQQGQQRGGVAGQQVINVSEASGPTPFILDPLIAILSAPRRQGGARRGQRDGRAPAVARRLVGYEVFLNHVWRPMVNKVSAPELKRALKEGLLPPSRVRGEGGGWDA